MLNSLKTMLGFSLLALIGVWIGCSSDTSPVASYSASKSTDEGTTVTGTIIESPAVTIPDTNLAKAIKAQLGLDDAATALTEADLDSLTTLNAHSKGIVNLTGLEHATRLDTLELRRNRITDLAPLASLTGLKYLELLGNDVVSWSPLEDLTNLEWLGIGGNGDIDLSMNLEYVAGLSKLKILRLQAMALDNRKLETLAHALVDLENLTSLNLSKNRRLTDFEPLLCLTKLEVLVLRNMPDSLHVFDADALGHDARVPVDPALLYLATLKNPRVSIHWD